MLVFQRKVGETVDIDGGITLTVCEIRSNQIKIGIEAPKETLIRRGEIAKDLRYKEWLEKQIGIDDEAEAVAVSVPSL